MLGAVWALMVIAIIWLMPEVPPALLIGSLFFPVYYTVLSLVLQGRRRKDLMAPDLSGRGGCATACSR